MLLAFADGTMGSFLTKITSPPLKFMNKQLQHDRVQQSLSNRIGSSLHGNIKRNGAFHERRDYRGLTGLLQDLLPLCRQQ